MVWVQEEIEFSLYPPLVGYSLDVNLSYRGIGLSDNFTARHGALRRASQLDHDWFQAEEDRFRHLRYLTAPPKP
jgi:hypothetical protein